MGVETSVVDAAPGRVLLAESPFYPGGGGQLADKGILHHHLGEFEISGIQVVDGQNWIHLADDAIELSGSVCAQVDGAFRQMMRELHTGTHLLNAFVFQSFNGALVSGAQLNDDGTARMDFDLPDADNDRLRVLEGPVNEAIRQCLAVRADYVTLEEARGEHGLIRSKSVAPPPTEDSRIRIVEIVGLDRQACGGTHLENTGASRAIKILKIDNKGRHNRRVRIGLVNP